MAFNVGDKVKWKSHSQGSWLEKIGEIAEIIAPHRSPEKERWPQLWKGAGPGFGRDHVSYVVVVGKKVYWPRVSKLECP